VLPVVDGRLPASPPHACRHPPPAAGPGV